MPLLLIITLAIAILFLISRMPLAVNYRQHVDENILKDCTHFHIMGSSLFSFHMVDAVKKAVTIVKANGGVISFDQNIRKEMRYSRNA